MTTQDNRLGDIAESFLHLDKLASDLTKMTERWSRPPSCLARKNTSGTPYRYFRQLTEKRKPKPSPKRRFRFLDMLLL